MELDYIQELKNDQAVGPIVEYNIVSNYKVRIVNRGERLFYQEIDSDRAIIIDIQVRNDTIFENSLIRWDNGKNIAADEKEIIIKRVISYFSRFQKTDVSII